MSDRQQPTNSIRIQLFREFSVEIVGVKHKAVDKLRMKELIAYLILNADKPQRRSSVAYKFWPESEESQAMSNLRNVLHQLKRDYPEILECLNFEQHSLTWVGNEKVSVDFLQVQQSMGLIDEFLKQGRVVDAVVQLENVRSLCTGELLNDFYSDWVDSIRESLREDWARILRRLLSELKRSSQYEEAISCSRLLIQLDQLSEENHRELIETLTLANNRTAALVAFNFYEKLLHKELEIEPSDALKQLHRNIVNGTLKDTAIRPLPHASGENTNPGVELKPKAKSLYLVWISALVILGVLFMLTAFFWKSDQLVSDKSIAVLPFQNASDLKADLYFSEGFHADLITQIASIHEVKIISLASVKDYQGTDKSIEDIGNELGVATIIEGSLQRSGDEIRVHVELVDTNSGFQLWSKTYLREMTAESVFRIQRSITESIVDELDALLTPEEEQHIAMFPTQSLAALEAYFIGNSRRLEGTSEGMTEAIAQYQKSIELDPEFAIAWAMLGLAYLDQIVERGFPFEEQVAKAAPCIYRALNLDDQSSEVYVALGKLIMTRDSGNVVAAETALKRAIELNPSHSSAYLSYALLKRSHYWDYEEALGLNHRALELDPHNLEAKKEIASLQMMLGSLDDSKRAFEVLLKDHPNNVRVLMGIGDLYRRGFYRHDVAIKYFRQAHALDSTNENITSALADTYRDLGDDDQFIYWAKRDLAIAPNSFKSTFLRGRMHDLKGETEQALAIYESLKKTDEFQYLIGYYAAKLYLKSGLPEKALQSYIDANPILQNQANPIVVERNNLVELIDYGYLLHVCGHEKQARQILEPVLEVLPSFNRMGSEASYQYFDAEIYIALGDNEGAIEAIEEWVNQGGCFNEFLSDAFIAELWELPAYRKLSDKVKKKLQKQRKRLKDMEENSELAPIPSLPNSL